MGKERMDDPKRLEEIIAYLGAIGKEIRTLEKIFGSMAAVRLLFYLVTHGGLRGVVTDSKDTINKECSLTRGKLEAARQELRSKFFIDFKTHGNKTRYTLDLARIAGACEAAGIGRIIGQNQPELTTNHYIAEYIPSDLQEFAELLKLDLEWFVGGFGPVSVRGGLKIMQGIKNITSPTGLLWKICNDRAMGWQGARTFPLQTESRQPEPQDLVPGAWAGGRPGSAEKAETDLGAFGASAPSRPAAEGLGRLGDAEPSAEANRPQEIPYREGQRQVYDFQVERIVEAYRELCRRRGVPYDSSGDARMFVELRLQENLLDAYLLAAFDRGISNGVRTLADLCREPPETPGNLQQFQNALTSAVGKVREIVSGKEWLMSDADRARVADIFEKMQLNVEYFDLGEVYRWAIGLSRAGRKVFRTL